MSSFDPQIEAVRLLRKQLGGATNAIASVEFEIAEIKNRLAGAEQDLDNHRQKEAALTFAIKALGGEPTPLGFAE